MVPSISMLYALTLVEKSVGIFLNMNKFSPSVRWGGFMNKEAHIKIYIWSWGDSLAGKVPVVQAQD